MKAYEDTVKENRGFSILISIGKIKKTKYFKDSH